MTRPKAGNEETKIQKCEATMGQRNFMRLTGFSLLLGFGLTIYLASQKQYWDALCGLALTLASATRDRLKRIRIGLHGIQAEWTDGRMARNERKFRNAS